MILQKLYRSLNSFRSRILENITNKAEINNIERKKKLWETVHLSSEENKIIRDYWKQISGCEIDTRWHRLYASYLKCPVKKDFFPEILYNTKLEKELSYPEFYCILSDKGFVNISRDLKW